MKYEDLEEYFKFYQENETRFNATTRYLQVDRKCKSAYSLVYSNLLMSICSDFEALVRYCFNRRDDEQLEVQQIISLIRNNEYFSSMIPQEVEFPGYGYLSPMEIITYRNSESFKWWTAYNKIKHNKLKSISNACQSNIVLALSSLYVFNRYAIKRCSEELQKDGEEKPDIFVNDTSRIKLLNFETSYTSLTGACFSGH